MALFKAVPGVTANELCDAISPLTPFELQAQTHTDAVESQLKRLSGSTQLLSGMFFAFDTIPLIVSAFRIANTFRLLVIHRTGELARR